MFSLNAAGDDPAAGVDTVCDGDNQGLKDTSKVTIACLSAVPSGEDMLLEQRLAATSTAMFAGATAWLDRERVGRLANMSLSQWVHMPCLVDERAQSGWCVPCGGMFSPTPPAIGSWAASTGHEHGDNQASMDAR